MKLRIEGMNQENVKHSNRAAILKLLSSKGPTSRKDIAAAIGLTPAAVTIICNELISSGVLVETGVQKEDVAEGAAKRAGRKKISVDINYQGRRVLCIAIESDETYITVTDLIGKIYGQRVLTTDAAMEPEAFLVDVAKEALKLLAEADVSSEILLGVGVTVPGIVNREKGISVLSHRIWEDRVPVKDILEKELQCPVVVENNVKAYAHGELIYGIGRTTDNLMFVKWGPGLGSAVTINQQVYEGRQHLGAEIGHVIVEPKGNRCGCGKCGCLETYISTHAILDEAKLVLPDRDLYAGRINEWASEPAVKEIMDRKIGKLALSTSNVISLLNPDRVVIYGKVFQGEGIPERFSKACMALDPHMEENYIQLSELSEQITYIGALAIAMGEFFF